MTGYLTGGLLTAMLVFQPAAATFAQTAKTPAKDAPKQMRLNGCISRDTATPAQFTFLDTDSGGKYRLTGKGLKKFVGHRVEIVGGPPGKGITFKTGLLPSPNVAAQAGAIDTATAAVTNLPGGAADANIVNTLPELHIIRLRGVEGSCQ